MIPPKPLFSHRDVLEATYALVASLCDAGRVVTAVTSSGAPPALVARYAAAAARLQQQQGSKEEEEGGGAPLMLFHTTTVAAAAAICREGFGRGVGLLSSTTAQALLQIPQLDPPHATLVCLAAVGRWHEDRSPPRAMRKKPRPGFDSMIAAGGAIVVVPDPARVLPLVVVTHRPAAAAAAGKTNKGTRNTQGGVDVCDLGRLLPRPAAGSARSVAAFRYSGGGDGV